MAQHKYFNMVDVETILRLSLSEAKKYVLNKMDTIEKLDKRSRDKLNRLLNDAIHVDGIAFGLSEFF